MPSALAPSLRDRLAAELRASLGDRSSTSLSHREHHSHGESWHPPGEPDIEEHGEALEVMRTIKRALDPQNLMNPGKMIAL